MSVSLGQVGSHISVHVGAVIQPQMSSLPLLLMHPFCGCHMIVGLSLFPTPPLGSPSSLEEPTCHMAMPRLQVYLG